MTAEIAGMQRAELLQSLEKHVQIGLFSTFFTYMY